RRETALEEALSVFWVACSIYMGAFVVYIGLKLPLGLSRDADAPAVGVAVSVSVIAVFCSARIPTDWKCAVRKSIFGLFALTLGVVGSVRLLGRPDRVTLLSLGRVKASGGKRCFSAGISALHPR